MSLLDDFLGRTLASSEAKKEQIDAVMGVPVLGLDALGSASYGPEAALTILIPMGLAGLAYMPVLIGAIILLLLMVYFSYRQTIAAYPNGGGSYVVAKENLGIQLGLLAAAALLTDYVLNVAVAISAGVGALISLVPALQSHILGLCLLILVLLTVINLRGVRTTGVVLSVPTFIFVIGLLGALALGFVKTILSGGAPPPDAPPPVPLAATASVSLWLLVRAFASGCTAMTGVEAVSNGVPLFTEPRVPQAQRSLTIIVGCLGLSLVGIGYLTHIYHIAAMDQSQAGYQSVISQLSGAILGRNIFYAILMASVIAVLTLSANTSFAGLPSLCRLLAEDHFLPNAFANLGRRLVYTIGILILALLSGLLLIMFGGITDHLIPLFAVGAFSAFTLSQAGMVSHWLRKRCPGWRRSLLINLVGAVSTGLALLTIIVAKFTEGAWVVIGVIPVLLAIFHGVKHHYDKLARELNTDTSLDLSHIAEPVVILPIHNWNNLAAKALRVAYQISCDITVVHIAQPNEGEAFKEVWQQKVQQPAEAARLTPPRLEIVLSPYRQLFYPILDVIKRIREEKSGRTVAVLVPQIVHPTWYEYILHSHRAAVFRFFLLAQGDGRTIVINTPWFLGHGRNKNQPLRQPLPAG
jgi:amino acid transporter